MADPVAVRRATADDVDAVVALGEVVVPATYGPIDEGFANAQRERWWSVASVTDAMGRLPHWVVDGPDDGTGGSRILGVANLGTSDGVPTMWKIYVRPAQQGAGVAGALLAAVEAGVVEDDDSGRPVLQLEYLAGNHRAERFYLKHGFVETGRAPFDGHPGLEQVWMRKELS